MATSSGSAGPRPSEPCPKGPAGANPAAAGGAKSASRPATTASKGRFTPKKDAGAKVAAPKERLPGYQTSGRYTAPTVHSAAERHETKPWVPYLMFGFLIVGLILIIGNYLEVLPGSSDGKYLLAGLLCITGGFATATQLR